MKRLPGVSQAERAALSGGEAYQVGANSRLVPKQWNSTRS
jgi:hypothetical protein